MVLRGVSVVILAAHCVAVLALLQRVFSLISARDVWHSLCSSWCFPLAFSRLLARVLTVFHLPNLKLTGRLLVANPRHRHGNSCNDMKGYCNLALAITPKCQ